jgi:hypothetical protein
MDQVVEHLPTKHKARSIPITANKFKKEKNLTIRVCD